MVTWLGATCFTECHIDCTCIILYLILKKYHIIFIIVLLRTPVTVAYFALEFSSGFYAFLSFLLLYIISMLYIIAILSLVLVRETI